MGGAAEMGLQALSVNVSMLSSMTGCCGALERFALSAVPCSPLLMLQRCKHFEIGGDKKNKSAMY